MREIKAPEDVECRIRAEEDEAKQRKTLADFLPPFFKENFFISSSEIVSIDILTHTNF
jgi:hypothetical protein